jgi:hypothetical protein
MKNLLLLFLFSFFIFHSAFSQNPLVKQWDKRFGGTGDDQLYWLQQTTDGGYILGGYSDSDSSGDKTQFSRGGNDYWIIKIDSLGVKQWDKRYGGSAGDLLTSLQQTNDGGYIVGGSSNSDSSGDISQSSKGQYDYWIIKADGYGNKQWDKRYGGTGKDYLYSLDQTTDGGYILGGYSYSDSSGDKTQDAWGYADYWIVKIDSIGNKQWDKRYGGTWEDWLRVVKQTTDGGYILEGYSVSDSSGDKTQNSWASGAWDYWIVKVDSLGNKQWDKQFGGTSRDLCTSMSLTSDGGYILVGYSDSDSSGDKTQPNWDSTGNTTDYWIVKIDSLGNKQWDKDYGGTMFEFGFGNISQTSDGGFIISSDSYSSISGDKTENNLGQEQTWIIKTDSLGIKQWDKTVFALSNPHEEAGLVIQTNDGCYAVANYTRAGIGGYKTQPNWDTLAPFNTSDYWIIKFCDSTLTTSIPIINKQSTSFNIFPNPAQDEFTISGLPFPVQIKMVDVFGREVFSQTIITSNPKPDSYRVQTSNFSNGVYLIKAYTGKGVFQQKLIINH